jgi:hypothetical protein
MPVSIDEQFKFVSAHVASLAGATEDGVRLFIPMFAAILGGSVWLRLQSRIPIPHSYVILSDLLVWLLGALCILMTVYNLWAWVGYRKVLSEMTADTDYPVQQPHWSSALIEMVIVAAIYAACAIFVFNNPLEI